MSFDFASVGLRIKKARGDKGITQEQLAEKIKSTRKHLNYLEKGKTGISIEKLVDISNALEVPISELLADSLTGDQSSNDTELHYILLDCTKKEEKIITKTAQALKNILRDNEK